MAALLFAHAVSARCYLNRREVCGAIAGGGRLLRREVERRHRTWRGRVAVSDGQRGASSQSDAADVMVMLLTMGAQLPAPHWAVVSV